MISISKEIFHSFARVSDGSMGKRVVSILKKNDGRKNIYTVILEIKSMTPEECEEVTFYTRKYAERLADAFLDTSDPNFYWSESIDGFFHRWDRRIK